MALRVEIWGLQLIQPFARMWQRHQQSSRDRAPQALPPVASAGEAPQDLGVWVGAIRLRDLPGAVSPGAVSPGAATPETGQTPHVDRASTPAKPRRDNVLYLKPRAQRDWDEVEQGQKVRRIFEQNRIVPASARPQPFPTGDRSSASCRVRA
ncbi:MAG: hypothetical protein AAFX40_13025 [Cyanobacteria bacterium J06639_1]